MPTHRVHGSQVSRFRIVPLVRTAISCALVLAVCSAPPASAASSVVIVDTSRTAWAFVNPGSTSDWRGVMQVSDATLTDGRSTMRKQATVSMNLWRRWCDVTGCMESVMSTTNAPATTSSWATDLASANIASTSAPVRVQRFRVDDSALSLIDDSVMLANVTLAAHRIAQDFSQTSTAKSSSLISTSRVLRVTADAVITVGSLRLSTQQASLTSSSTLTTQALRGRK